MATAKQAGPDGTKDLALWRLTAVQAVERLRAGTVTPLELIEAALARIAEVGPQVNAVVTLAAERARKQAKALMKLPPEKRGLLAGLPVAIKDLNDVAGVRTTYGSPLFADNVPKESDFMVQALEASGGIPIGMTNTPEFGAGANTFNAVFGETLNPWDTRLNCGGSSGGSAVAVATGQVWLASGSDLGGSLRTPASFCHIVGLRPTPGRVPAGPGENRFDTLAVNGPMARNVEDVALMLDAMAGERMGDPVSLPAPATSFLSEARKRQRPLRVAVCLEPAGLPIEPEVIAVCRAAIDRLAGSGITVMDATPDFAGVPDAFQTLRAFDYQATMGPFAERHRDKLKPDVIWNIEKGKALGVDRVGKAMLRRSRLHADMVAFFATYDLLMMPAAPILPRDIKERWPRQINNVQLDNYVEWLKLASLATMAGCPAMSLPAGFSADGRPVGLQIVARPRNEAGLLSAALVFEEMLGQRDLVPIDPRVQPQHP